MSKSIFDPTFEQLPLRVAIFPLSGVLLLPGGKLPLNIFEPRYLAMTRDALAGDRIIGMVQPLEGQENAPIPEVYPLGCAGRITSFSETDDGRYQITLSGLCRFEIAREIEMLNGYRRAIPNFEPYRKDFEEAPDGVINRKRLIGALRVYFKLQNIEADWKAIQSTPDERLVTTLAMVCPFEPSEKQALLQSPDLADRGRVMTALFEMAALGSKGGEARH